MGKGGPFPLGIRHCFAFGSHRQNTVGARASKSSRSKGIPFTLRFLRLFPFKPFQGSGQEAPSVFDCFFIFFTILFQDLILLKNRGFLFYFLIASIYQLLFFVSYPRPIFGPSYKQVYLSKIQKDKITSHCP